MSAKPPLANRLFAFAVGIIAERWDSVETGIDWERVDELAAALELTYPENTIDSLFETNTTTAQLDPELKPLIDQCIEAKNRQELTCK
jgi:Mn-dependent DtxR family transcriptional regulator